MDVNFTRIPIFFFAAFLFGLGPQPGAAASEVATLGLFGSVELRAGSPWDWQRVVGRVKNDLRVLADCRRDPAGCEPKELRTWLETIESLRGHGPEAQLRLVNSLANRQSYVTDDVNFGRPDYYASPLEFLRRSGDCEDFAIFKYFVLKALGFSDSKLRVVLVMRMRDRSPHAVLAVYLDENIYILDNATDRVLPHHALTGYQPLFSFNAARGWVHLPS